jgi:O-acetyl-ADP-ribose deacetylase (regulator of RNase III)
MIAFKKGNLMESKACALCNTVNTVGVMGKGIALQFKLLFPNNFEAYRKVCERGKLVTGQILSIPDYNLIMGERLIVNFPTKVHWKNPSEYSYIESGLISLNSLIRAYPIDSIAIPPLGCGNGGLDWSIVKEMIVKHLSELDADIEVYQPNFP